MPDPGSGSLSEGFYHSAYSIFMFGMLIGEWKRNIREKIAELENWK
jgi:hypothetical protein